MNSYEGILLVDKPKGWTSFDVVAKVRGLLQNHQREMHIARGYCHSLTQGLSGQGKCRCKLKVGHTGTLDPMATGLLVLCVGSYTKKVPDMIKHDKTYIAELTLGATSTTGDAEGEIKPGRESLVSSHEKERNAVPDFATVSQVLEGFVGEQMQRPPAFSALKVNGKRAYDLARAGKEVKLEPRKISIHSIELNNYAWPLAQITCSVGSGTYIRSLAEDIGEKLGVGAYLSGLRRTVVDMYKLEDALQIEGATAEKILENFLVI